MTRPPRRRLWATPKDAGLAYEDVEFPARDGLRLSGWFVPAADGESAAKATIALVHGWPWNRLGEAADNFLTNVSGGLPVDLLRLAHALHEAGFNVLMFDLRNHGQSADGGAVTFGLQESNDVLGALDYLASRPDVDEARIGTVGFSMGANAILFALPHAERMRAAIAVQPTSPSLFARRYASDLLGPLGKPVLALTDLIYSQVSHLPLKAIEPLMAAAGAGNTPVLYVQGKGDRWGSVSNVAQMVEKTPNAADPLFVDTHHRFGGYRYVVQNPEVLTAFFAEHFRS
jgi:pimeloyl-ACP methyl ester carboxylesterase